jgi:NitT/TauT family transport system substrate-binding protein
MTKPFPVRLAATTAILLLGSCSRPAAPEVKGLIPVTIQADWYAEAEQGGFYQALARGFYRDAGLDVTILNGGPGGYPMQKVATGVSDMALGRSDDVILAVARAHLPMVIICAYMEKDPMSVIVHAESPIRDFPDLAGRVVIADPTSAWISYLKAKYGMDFSIIPINYGLSEFMADKSLSVQGFATSEPYYIQKHGESSRTLLIANSGYKPYRVVIANRGFVRAHPEAARAFVAASLKGWEDYLEGDPTPANTLIFARNEALTADFMAYSVKAMADNHLVRGSPALGERLGLMTRSRMQEQADLYMKLKVLDVPVPLDDFVSFDFLPPELAALAR